MVNTYTAGHSTTLNYMPHNYFLAEYIFYFPSGHLKYLPTTHKTTEVKISDEKYIQPKFGNLSGLSWKWSLKWFTHTVPSNNFNFSSRHITNIAIIKGL